MSVFEVDRVHGTKRDEFFEIDALVGSSLEVFEFLLGDRRIWIFTVLKTADEVIALNHDVAHRAIVLIARESRTYCAAGEKTYSRFLSRYGCGAGPPLAQTTGRQYQVKACTYLSKQPGRNNPGLHSDETVNFVS